MLNIIWILKIPKIQQSFKGWELLSSDIRLCSRTQKAATSKIKSKHFPRENGEAERHRFLGLIKGEIFDGILAVFSIGNYAEISLTSIYLRRFSAFSRSLHLPLMGFSTLRFSHFMGKFKIRKIGKENVITAYLV